MAVVSMLLLIIITVLLVESFLKEPTIITQLKPHLYAICLILITFDLGVSLTAALFKGVPGF